ncbi:MAG: hypothetical protein ACM3JJ_05495 [Hyphomicrobiales bacterium]
MASRVRKVGYCYVKVPNRAGQGARVLAALAEAGVNLTAFLAFPAKAGTAQIDLIADRLGPVRRVASRLGLRVSRNKKAFLIQGDDKPGAVHRVVKRLADVRVNATASAAVAAGGKRFGMLLWVKPKDYARASRALGAR